jgi:arylsulfatase A-like enzyme
MDNNQYKTAILHGLVCGVVVAFAYATVEFILLGLIPLLTTEQMEWNTSFGVASALLIAGYAIIGAALGATVGLFFKNDAQGHTANQAMLASTAALPIAFAANLLAHWPLTGGGMISFTAALLATVAITVSLRMPERADSLRVLTDPMGLSLLLLLPSWLSNDMIPDRSGVIRFLVIGSSVLAVLAAIKLLQAFVKTLFATPLRYATCTMALLATAAIIGVVKNPRAPQLPPRQVVSGVKRPNVVMIVMDTVRADHTSLYGYERDTTPFLRELAKESTVYNHSFAVSDITLTSHASMFTGLYPRTHGAHLAPPLHPFGRPLGEEFTTLPEMLRDNGYRTMGIAANFVYLPPRFGLAQGFELYDWRFPTRVVIFGEPRKYSLRDSLRRLFYIFTPTSVFDQNARQAEEVTDEAIRALSQPDKDKPYFLFVNYLDAHEYSPPGHYRTKYPCSDFTILSSYTKLSEQVMQRQREITTAEQQCIVSSYDAGISYIDSQLRRLVGALESRGQLENTLLIITSDHGEAFGRRNLVGHGGISVYQEEISVPLLIKFPGEHSPERMDKAVTQVDLMPTVLDIVGISRPGNLAGVDLQKNVLVDQRAIVSASYPAKESGQRSDTLNHLREALVYQKSKLILSSSGERELFDLSRDPNEEHNLYRADDARAIQLSSMFATWRQETVGTTSKAAPVNDRESIKRLKTLGYAQ